MNIETISNMGDFGTNAYIVSSKENAVLIDAPCDPELILSKLKGRKLLAILLTHGHVDHILAAAALRDATGADVYISEDDKPLLTDPRLCLADYFGEAFIPCDNAKTFSDGDELNFFDMSFKVIATPGHTPGSSCFVIENVIFSGDTLFKNSIGRDFGWKCYTKIIDSIEKLYSFNKNYRVLPGHDAPTELYDELIFNPYLRELKNKLTN